MKIQNLINQMFKKGKDAFGRNMNLKKNFKNLVRRHGSEAVVNSILNELFTRQKAGKLPKGEEEGTFGSPVFHLVNIVEEFAESQHAQQLAEMLLWDEIVFDPDRSVRGTILGTLERIGCPSIISILQEYAEKVCKVDYAGYLLSRGRDPLYSSTLHERDQEEVKNVMIKICQ